MSVLEQLQGEVARLRTQQASIFTSLISKKTRISYRYDWLMFQAWCASMELISSPATPDTVSLYLVSLLDRGKKIATARRRCCAIAWYHHEADYASPVDQSVRDLIVGAQRQRKEKPRQMRPLTLAQLRTISIQLAEKKTPVSVRNRALMLVGFASALRRSSLAELRLEDAEIVEQGLVLHIQGEKQDQEGRGRLIGILRGKHPETCPVTCLEQWLAIRGAAPGALFSRLDQCHRGEFMDGECVYRVVKKCVGMIGLDPNDRYGGHSLRSGFITAAGESGAGELLIAAQSGHQNMQVLRKYFRRSELFRANAGAALDL